MTRVRKWSMPRLDPGVLDNRPAVSRFARLSALGGIVLSCLVTLCLLPLFYLTGLLDIAVPVALGLTLTMSLVTGVVVATVMAIASGNAIRHLGLSRARYERLSRTDMLSGLPNRRAFWALLERQVDQGALVIFDLDRFKAINDGHGHLAGDTVIRGVASIIRDVFPAPHVAGRLGGEEFGVIISGRDASWRLALVEQVRLRVEELVTVTDGVPVSTTVSAGVADFDDRPVEQVYAAADKALYLAKACGRNRLVHESAVDAALVGTGSMRPMMVDTRGADGFGGQDPESLDGFRSGIFPGGRRQRFSSTQAVAEHR